MKKALLLLLLEVFITTNSQPQTQPERLSRDRLIEDTRELVTVLQESHPDPYQNFGGKIAFHREFQNLLVSIPEDGMSPQDFYNLLMPFVSQMRDMHTGLVSNLKSDLSGSGLPLKFKIVDQDLVAMSVPSAEMKELLGSRLVSVGGIKMAELRIRQTNLRGIENEYGELAFLTISLKTAQGVKRLIPEWNGKDAIPCEFLLKSGAVITRNFQNVAENPEAQVSVNSVLSIPPTDKSDVVYGFLDDKKATALLIIAGMERYREGCEGWFSSGMEGARELTGIAYRHFHVTEPPADQETLLSGIPSATEAFVSMINDLKKNKTKNLIIDLRENTGGNSFMKDMLVYMLFGKDGLIKTNGGYQIIKYSDLYFQNFANDSLSLINSKQQISLTKDDYNFNNEQAYRNQEFDYNEIEESFRKSPTFWKIYAGHQYDQPSVDLRNIIVLSSPFTTSSGFNLLTSLCDNGAKLVGTASAQPGNNFGDLLFFVLGNSGIKGYVPFKQNVTFADDPVKGKCLMPDFPLTYRIFKSFNFDPESEILYTLQIIKSDRAYSAACRDNLIMDRQPDKRPIAIKKQ